MAPMVREKDNRDLEGFLMNRNQRRVQMAQQKKTFDKALEKLTHSGPMEFHIIPITIMLDPSPDLQMIEAISKWTDQVNSNERQPYCLCCEHQWIDGESKPPRSFATVMTARDFRPSEQADVAMVGAICEDCAPRPDLTERCQEFYRSIWPNIRYHRRIHDMPETTQ
jgi:hypothetical protein